MMSDLKIGVIGAGGRGGVAANAHKPGEGSRITACCDLSDKTLDSVKEKYGNDITTTKDYKELLAQDLDGVFICSPDFLHEEHAAAALQAGIPIYLEKPMAITIEGCDRLLTLAKEKGVRLFVGHNMRYMSIIRKMKKLIDDGAIGELKTVWCRHFISYGGDAYFRDWHSEAKFSTGLLLQKGAHDIDVIHWLSGAYSTRVSAFGNLSVYDKCGRRSPEEPGVATFDQKHWPPLEQTGFSPKIDVEDQTVMMMQMEGGILGCYMQCHFTPDCSRNYTFIGTEGRIENIGDGPDSPIMIWNKRKDTYRTVGDAVAYGDETSDGGHGGADPVIVGEFVEYLRHGTATTATPQAARMSVAAGYQATMSLRNGGMPMEVPALPDGVATYRY